ncbi:MAG: proline iminopeptidase-family hydrolase, partial [Ignavibacteriaceae bacterium]
IFLILVGIVFTFITCSQIKLEPRQGFIEMPDGKVWYRIYGSGNQTPLLLIHGGPGSASCRLAPIKAISDERPVILYDQLGSGNSDRPEDSTLWQLPRFVDELDRLIDSLQLNRVHILGHSWGCALAVEYFLTKHSEKVESMILAGPLLSTKLWIEDANYLRTQLPDSIQQILNYHERAGSIYSDEYLSATDYFYHRYLYRLWPIPEYAKCDSGYFNEVIYEQMWGPTEFNATGNLVNFDRVDRLNEIDIPVLLLIGEYDEVRPETMKKIQQLFPNAKLEIVNDAAHVSMVDQPEEFNRIIRKFINSIN